MCIGDPTRRTGKTEEGRRTRRTRESQCPRRKTKREKRNERRDPKDWFSHSEFRSRGRKTGHLDMGQLRDRVGSFVPLNRRRLPRGWDRSFLRSAYSLCLCLWLFIMAFMHKLTYEPSIGYWSPGGFCADNVIRSVYCNPSGIECSFTRNPREFV